MAEALWTSDAILAATGGRLHGAPFAVNGVSIDSREIGPGDLFVALADVRDGHDFVTAARGAGAAGALVSREAGEPSIVVGDTLAALERMGEAARLRAPKTRRGAVTGSVGKTSVTQAIRAGLARAGRSHGSVKSYNNHIGVPLTLARMPADTERAIFEIGMNHAGEISPLVMMVHPHAVCVTNVGAVHVENFADGEAGIAKAKAEIIGGLDRGGTAVLNADDAWFDFLKGEARRAGAKVRTFGKAKGCDAQLVDFASARGGGSVSAMIDGKRVEFPIRQRGVHWGPMSLCVLLMLKALDVDLETSLAALGAFEPLVGRGAEIQVKIPGGGFTLVDDAYNANPISVTAALRTLGSRAAKGRRLVVLTDMLELGEKTRDYHAALADPIIEAGVDLAFLAGPLMHSLWQALPPTRRGGYAETAAELAPLIERAVQPGDVVMVKGSRDSKAKVLAEGLAALGAVSGEGA